VAATGPAPRRVGRARRFPPDQERTLLFDAAMTVLRRNGYTDAPIADMLEESGLSTRSFYRHFASKDELLLALYRRDAESAAKRVRRRVEAADGPIDGLRTWIDDLLSYRLDRRRAERVAILSSESVRRTEFFVSETERAWRLIEEPLVEVLEAGHAEGVFPAAHPARDATLIRAMVREVGSLDPGGPPPDPAEVSVEALLGFCLRALGALAR